LPFSDDFLCDSCVIAQTNRLWRAISKEYSSHTQIVKRSGRYYEYLEHKYSSTAPSSTLQFTSRILLSILSYFASRSILSSAISASAVMDMNTQYSISPFDLIDTSKSYEEITSLASLLHTAYFVPLLNDCENLNPPLEPWEHVRLKDISEKFEQYARNTRAFQDQGHSAVGDQAYGTPGERMFAEMPFGAVATPDERWIVSVLLGILPGHECAFRGRGKGDVDATDTIEFLNNLQNRVPWWFPSEQQDVMCSSSE
jgi:hypothetical protein